jgi:L-threonylcarbamoyladenylate synthase
MMALKPEEPLLTPSEAELDDGARRLAAGELVAFPTETVYGLGARADDDAAVARIYAAKGRPAGHPLIVHVVQAQGVRQFAAVVSPAAQRLMDAFWPGPLTLILPRRPGVGAAAAGGQDSIGLRWPSHPVAQALLSRAAALGVTGVAAPSANRFGRVSPTTAAHVAQEFGGRVHVLDGGVCAVGIESAIVDCTRERPALLRPGQITRHQLEQALGQPLLAPDDRSPRASGTLASHYAPSVPLQLWASDALAQRLLVAPPAGQVVGVYSRCPAAAALGWVHRPMADDAVGVAHELFSVLRDLDTSGVDAIWVEQPPAGADYEGVLDRLTRAAF